MRRDQNENQDEDQPDPSEVQPTDNSSGVPVDLERLEEVQEDLGAPRQE